VASSVAVSLTVAALIRGETIEDAIERGLTVGSLYHTDCREWGSKSLEELDLDEGIGTGQPKIGYTWKCMGAGFWALRNFRDIYDGTGLRGATTAMKFERALENVILEGGDADTNGAVAGSMMGASIGVPLLPSQLVQDLRNRDRLDEKLQNLFDLGT